MNHLHEMRLAGMIHLAGLLHLGLIAAGALMPRAVGLREHLALLPEFIRRLFWVYYGFIGLCLISFGMLSALLANELASGDALALGVCAFLTVFWIARFLVAMFVFDVKPYLAGPMWKAGYYAINVVFAVLPVIYGWAAIKGSGL